MVNMDFILGLLGLCAMATASQQHLSPSDLSLRQAIILSPQSHPLEPLWGLKIDQSNPQNLNKGIDLSPLGPQHLGVYEIAIEDQPDAQDIALFPTVNIPTPLVNNLLQSYGSTQNSLGLYSGNVQTDPIMMQYQGSNLLYPESNDGLPSLLGYQDAGTGQLPSLLPSQYELNQQYSPIREEDRVAPDWTSMEIKIQHAVHILKINTVDPESVKVVPWWDTRAEYTLLLGVVLELMEQVSIHGPQSYDEIFTGTVLVSLTNIRMNLTPNQLAQQLVETLQEVDRASAKIRSYTNSLMLSPYCKSPFLCNEYVDIVLKTTTDQRLQDERKLLLTAVNLANIFLEHYAEEFEMMTKQSMAYIYFGDLLRRGDLNELKPLVLGGAELIRQVKDLSPEQG